MLDRAHHEGSHVQSDFCTVSLSRSLALCVMHVPDICHQVREEVELLAINSNRLVTPQRCFRLRHARGDDFNDVEVDMPAEEARSTSSAAQRDLIQGALATA